MFLFFLERRLSKKELIVLGTSSQQPTRFRNHGAYLVRMADEGFLFDPGEGTQRQFIFADTPPTAVTQILISHFHGDHCLGVGSILMRLNLDKVPHTVHCYFPASCQKHFTYLRKACIYHEHIKIEEHPIEEEGIFFSNEKYTLSARFLDHGVPTLGYRIEEAPKTKFDREKLQHFGIKGPLVKELETKKRLVIKGKKVFLEEVSWEKPGLVFSYILDTRICENAYTLAQNADLLLAESTYLNERADLANRYFHMTAKEAALLAKKSSAKKLILTHFSARYRETLAFQKEAREHFPESYAANDFDRFSFGR